MHYIVHYQEFSLQKSRELNIELEYLFYLQLKQIFHSSLIHKGEFLDTIRKHIKLSETSISTNIKRLREKGFIERIYRKGKHIGYRLQTYHFIYKNLLEFTDGHLRRYKHTFTRNKILSRRQLRHELEILEITSQGCRNIEKELKSSSCKQVSSEELQFQMSCTSLAHVIGRKSSSTGHTLAKRMINRNLVTKQQVKEQLDKNTLTNEELVNIRLYGGKKFYSEAEDQYFEQKSNLYTFSLFNVRLGKTFLKDSCRQVVLKKLSNYITY